MAYVYVEPRRKAGGPIEDYVIEDHANHALHSPFKTQKEAIDWANQQGHAPLVADVRTTAKGDRVHWRPA